MPVNKKWTWKLLIGGAGVPLRQGMDHVRVRAAWWRDDTPENARETPIAGGLRCKVNLIGIRGRELSYDSSAERVAGVFKHLRDAGIPAFVRRRGTGHLCGAANSSGRLRLPDHRNSSFSRFPRRPRMTGISTRMVVHVLRSCCQKIVHDVVGDALTCAQSEAGESLVVLALFPASVSVKVPETLVSEMVGWRRHLCVPLHGRSGLLS